MSKNKKKPAWYVSTMLELKRGKPSKKGFYFIGSKQDCEAYIDVAMLAAHG